MYIKESISCSGCMV